uniref:PDZ domain-containing protein n=1 Tax=Wuchereria bancrofti TaxID=6293 RepID=A0A1I8EAJ8_WUCBA
MKKLVSRSTKVKKAVRDWGLMKAFQNLRNTRTTSSSSQVQSSDNTASNNEDQTADRNNIKQRKQSPINKFSPSSQFKTSVRKSNSIAEAISDEKHPINRKVKKAMTPLVTRRGKSVSSPKAQISQIQNNLGFPCELPDDLVVNVNIQAKFNHRDKKVGVVITKSLLILRIEEYSIFYGMLKICDFLTHIEDEPITSKREFYDKLKLLRDVGKEFNLRLRRPLWNTPATRLPKGYDRAPGYSYIRGLMILYPGGNLGMNVKSYNSKVYVTSIDQMSIASAACLMGDCIVDVDGTPVTSTVSCGERVLMTIERAVDVQAIRVVKFVLLVEKVPEKDPRMAQDTTKIGLNEAEKIRQNALPGTLKGIYRGKHGYGQKRLVIHEMSMFTPIGADPFNPLLMQAVPPKKMDIMHASKSGQGNISTPLQRSKE